MLQTDGGYLCPTEPQRRQNAAVPCDDLLLGIDQHRHDKSERLDAARNLADLSGRVYARIVRIKLQLGERTIDYLNSTSGLIETSPGIYVDGASLHEWFQPSRNLRLPACT